MPETANFRLLHLRPQSRRNQAGAGLLQARRAWQDKLANIRLAMSAVREN
jgi:hypothetical protein